MAHIPRSMPNPFNNQFLPPFIIEQEEHHQMLHQEQLQRQRQQQQMRQEYPSPLTALRLTKIAQKKHGKGLWVDVSGFEPDRAYEVYRFFFDIGHIVEIKATSPTAMQLRYTYALDHRTALSYDNQKVGYGADVRVRVKSVRPELPEQPEPLPALRIESPDERVQLRTEVQQASIYVIGIERANGNGNTSLSQEQETQPEKQQQIIQQKEQGKEREQDQLEFRFARRKWSLTQWLKQKISYIFYFY